MGCAIWYHLYNLKNVKNNHGRVLPLVKLQASAYIYPFLAGLSDYYDLRSHLLWKCHEIPHLDFQR